MADIVSNIDLVRGGKIWAEIADKQELADFHKKKDEASFDWPDIADVIAYERAENKGPCISAMMSMCLIKKRFPMSYLRGGDVFVGSFEDRWQDCLHDVYFTLLDRIPAWDMSRGVYLDEFLKLDIANAVKTSADKSIYGTGKGRPKSKERRDAGKMGPGVGIWIGEQGGKDEGSEDSPQVHTQIADASNLGGEMYSNVERSMDRGEGRMKLMKAIMKTLDPEGPASKKQKAAALSLFTGIAKLKTDIVPKSKERAYEKAAASLLESLEMASGDPVTPDRGDGSRDEDACDMEEMAEMA